MRLNMQTKEKMISAIVENATKDRIENLQWREASLADEVYRHFVGRYQKEIEALPSDWFAESDSIKLYIHSGNGENRQTPVHVMDKEGRFDYQLKMSKPRAMPHSIAKNGCHLIHKGTMAIDALQLMQEHKELWTQVKKLREETRAFLKGHTTAASLLKEWPEAERFLPEQKEPSKPQVTGELLNRRINNIAAATQ